MRSELSEMSRGSLAESVAQAVHCALLPQARETTHREYLTAYARASVGEAVLVALVEKLEESNSAEPQGCDVHLERLPEAVERLGVPEE